MADDTKKPLYQLIASALDAYTRCQSDDANPSQQAWESKWEDYIERCAEELPSGSGFDTQVRIWTENVQKNRITMAGSYHKMDENGSYDGWADYKVVVKPSLIHGAELMVYGGDSDFREYCHEVFRDALFKEYPTSQFHEVPETV